MAEKDRSMEEITPPGDDEYFVEDKSSQTDMEIEITAEVHQIEGKLKKLSTAEPMDSSEPIIIIIASFNMPPTVLDQEESKIKWIGIPRVTIDAVTNKILQELKEKDPQKPKWITVAAYQQFLATHDSSTLERHLSKITNAAMESKIHKVSLATFYHVPSEEKLWNKASMLNQHLRLLNLDMNMNPNNVHKGLNFSFNHGKVCYVRYDYWTERMNNTGVGSTLNFNGLTRYKNYLLKFIHGGGFEDNQGPLVRAIGGDGSPAPLCYTKGYKGNALMMEIIEKSGLRMPTRPAGDVRTETQKRIERAKQVASCKEANRTDLQKRVEKSRVTARQLAAASKEKYGDLEFEDKRTKNKGGKENGMSGKDRLEERDRKRKDDKVHQLTQEINKLKLEGIKARKRSRSKYQDFEREVEKLKDRIRQKERFINDLRKDLARAEVDSEEWKEIANKTRFHDRGPKRARRY